MQAAREQLQVVFLGEAHGAVDGVGRLGHGQRGLAAARLGHGHAQPLGEDALPRAAQPGRHARGEDMLAHHRQLVLDGLELADGAAELLAVVRILQRALEHLHERARQLRCHQAGLQRAQVQPTRQGDIGSRRRADLVGAPAQVHVQAEGRRLGLRLRHGQQATTLRMLHQHAVRHRAQAHGCAVQAAIRLEQALRQRSGPWWTLRPRARQQRARQHGLAQRHGQRMGAGLRPDIEQLR